MRRRARFPTTRAPRNWLTCCATEHSHRGPRAATPRQRRRRCPLSRSRRAAGRNRASRPTTRNRTRARPRLTPARTPGHRRGATEAAHRSPRPARHPASAKSWYPREPSCQRNGGCCPRSPRAPLPQASRWSLRRSLRQRQRHRQSIASKLPPPRRCHARPAARRRWCNRRRFRGSSVASRSAPSCKGADPCFRNPYVASTTAPQLPTKPDQTRAH
mmetsp:Transcript_3007/g.8509  ORF Transcript_3007/g.8509 Transcript_3007/m.8509 type:complete len:216 (+) Transcript_3007:207-854(+)